MSNIVFWKGKKQLPIIVHSDTLLPEDFVKIGILNNLVFILDINNHLWQGEIENQEFLLKQTNLKAVDFTVYHSHLYLVNEFGRVYKLTPGLEICEEIILHEEANSCIHGYTTASHRVFIRQVCAGGMGILYVSDRGELWASGEHPQLNIRVEDGPTKVFFFEGRHVTCCASGEDFNVIVAHRRDESCPVNVNGDIGNGETEIFISNCPQCISENAVSPLSPQSYSETCPLGLQLKKSNESLSASSSTSKNNDSPAKKSENGNTSSSTEADSYRVPETLHANHIREDNVSPSTDEEKGDRVSMLLINTEAARQFLTRQLSWMSSGGEELLAEVSVPTRIIRQNVSTMASLVYEGVKTVGDKVATLSRHMSGGSDNNSDSFEEFEELNRSNASITSSFKWDWSCSEGSEEAGAERSGAYQARGARLVRAEVWAWGSAHHGQLGLGDTIRRHKPVLIGSVSHVGVRGVWCGSQHSIAVTLDGRALAWGSDSHGQVSGKCGGSGVVSSPVPCGRAAAAAASAKHSVLIAADNASLVWLPPLEKADGESKKVVECKRVLCCGDVTFGVTGGMGASADLTHEQCYLEELLSVQASLLKPLSRRPHEEPLTSLCSRYTELLHTTAAVTASLLVDPRGTAAVLNEAKDEILLAYERYSIAYCDVVASNGFATMARCVETPAKLVTCFSDRLPTRKTSAEAVLSCAFAQPLTHIAVYKGMVSRGGGNDLAKWESLLEMQETRRKEAEATRAFWESAGRLVDTLRTAQRRLVRESRSYPLSLHNASRFSSHWFILLSDVLVHVTGNSSHTLQSLDTTWVEACPDSDSLQNSFLVILPEETLTLTAGSAHEKTEWLQAFRTAIRLHLNKQTVPDARTASYTFTKHPQFKDAKYSGRWMCGKLEGVGRLEWNDGRVYTGHFHNGACHGSGRLEIPGVSVYDGQWRDGFQNGHGTTRYENGDVYIGYYKDGLENGHGVRKTGRFMSSQASFYVGEWCAGQKQGYGVINNIGTGEKYLGCWSNNMKSGSGLIVTLDGIYYEGCFVQDVLTGHGVMVFEDGTHYEGELREAGVFSGKGTLTFSSGDTFEGTLHGAWNEGVKISGTLHKQLPTSSPPRRPVSKPSSFGQLCVGADQKWKGIFRQVWAALGAGPDGKSGESKRAWECIAAMLNASKARHHELLHTIPEAPPLDTKYISAYLTAAFETVDHPLGRALSELVEGYTTTYGGVLVHPLLLPQAVAELHSITLRLYQVARLLFPCLPCAGSGDAALGPTALLHPIVLPRLYSSLLVLYSLENKQDDDTYWKRLLKWNRHPDTTLMAFLGIDRKFWASDEGGLKRENMFSTAVETLQQLKTTFSPMEKLMVIRNTFQEITKAVECEVGSGYMWTMDDLFPVFQYVVVRSHIQELGSEIHFIDDFMEPALKPGELGIMFTTLKACFYQILQEKISISS